MSGGRGKVVDMAVCMVVGVWDDHEGQCQTVE